MPADDIAISVRNLTKTYRIFGHPGDRIKQAATFGLRKYHREFTALKDVSFDIKKGETVGIIGRNGCGKSTLLQVICGILKPTSGTSEVNGRVSALLELGAGFNPDFTGRENIYFQGTLLGLKKDQIDQKFPDIAAFAEIGQFIDQPVRTYSSGMFVRLAFSVAIHVSPDILVVDEALSVGDAVFQHRSIKRVQSLIESGTTIVLVSHDRSLISSTCSRCILLDEAQVRKDGPSPSVFDYYEGLITSKRIGAVHTTELGAGLVRVTSGSGDALVEAIRLLGPDGEETDTLEVGVAAKLAFIVRAIRPISTLTLGFSIRDRLGQTVFTANTRNFRKEQINVDAGKIVTFHFSFNANIGAGTYSVSTILSGENGTLANRLETQELAYFFAVHNTTRPLSAGTAWLDPSLNISRDLG